MWKLASVLALLIVAVLAGWFFLGEEAAYEEIGGSDNGRPDELLVPPLPLDPGVSAPPVLPGDPGEEPLLPEDPGWVLPPLNQSDPLVREQLTALGVPDSWTGQEELVRRLTVVIENAARGEYPRRQLGLLALPAPFRVIERDGRLYVDPANHARIDPLLDILESIDPRLLARLLGFLQPLVDEALAELGGTGGARPLMAAGLQRVLDVPLVTEEVEVVRPNVFYVYADPELEQLRPLQKLVLRAGPGNVLRLQNYLRRLGGLMGITAVTASPL